MNEIEIRANLNSLLNRIGNAARSCGRDPVEIKLVAVTKTHPPRIIDEAIRAGIDIIGENKVQEAEAKLPELKESFREFHYIGHLQSNKVNKLLELKPHMIHSIDKIKTAKKISQALQRSGREQKILVQVNTSGEESKFGVEPEKCLQLVKEIDKMPNILLSGLMTIGRLTSDRSEIRACFRKLRQLSDEIRGRGLDRGRMKYLSMGMTADFEIAIEEGANIIRIGSAIFGPRSYRPGD